MRWLEAHGHNRRLSVLWVELIGGDSSDDVASRLCISWLITRNANVPYMLPAALTFDIIMPVNSAELHHMSFVSTCLRFPGQPLVGTVKPLFIYWVAFYFSFYFGQIFASDDKRARWKEDSYSIRSETTHQCDFCNKDFTPALVYSAASDVATVQQEINTIKKTH